jgi:hypothetical protein
MGLFSGDTSDSDHIQVEKYSVASTMNLIRIIDWETQVILYTDTTREGYTSVPFSDADIDIDDAPSNIKQALDSDSTN